MNKISLFQDWSLNGREIGNISNPFCFDDRNGCRLENRLPEFTHDAFIEFYGLPHLTDLYLGGEYIKTVLFDRELVKLEKRFSGAEISLRCLSSAPLGGVPNVYAASGDVYIIPYGTDAVLTEENDKGAQLAVKADLVNTGAKKRLAVNVSVFRNGNKRIARKKKYFTLENGSRTVEIPLSIKKYEKYDFIHTKKYRLEVLLEDAGKILDSSDSEFGIASRLEIGGKLLGAVVPGEKGILGRSCCVEHEKRILSCLRDIGYNAVRYTGVPSEEALLAADELGMKVVVDVFDNWSFPNGKTAGHLVFKDSYLPVLSDNIRYLRNHPSIVMYCIGNGIEEAYGRGAERFEDNIIPCIKKIDDRCVTAAIRELAPTKEELEKNGITEDLSPDELIKRGRAVGLFEKITGEFRKKLDVIGYSEPDREILIRDYSKNSVALSVTQDKFFDASFDMLKSDEVIGVFSSCGIGADGGDMDATCLPTPLGIYKKAYISKTANGIFVSPEESESLESYRACWNPCEGNVSVKVVTPGEVVALYINDRIVGRKLAGKPNKFTATFSVPYEEGVLEAVCFLKGREISRISLGSVGEPKRIRLLSGKKNISRLKNEVSFIDVWAVDSNGNVAANLDGKAIKVAADEGLIVLAAGNAYGPSADKAVAELVGGHALIAVSGKTAGKYSVTVSGEGIFAGKIQINVKD